MNENENANLAGNAKRKAPTRSTLPAPRDSCPSINPPPKAVTPIVYTTGESRFEFIELIDSGGQGEVWRGRDRKFGKDVALKVPKFPENEENGNSLDAANDVCEQEAKILRSLEHFAFPAVFEIGELNDGRRYFAMQLIKGMTLANWLTQSNTGRTTTTETDVLTGVIRGMARAHENKTYHRDLKPENVIVDVHNQPFILDFGIGRQLALTSYEGNANNNSEVGEIGDTNAKGSNTLFGGSKGFISPEVAQLGSRASLTDGESADRETNVNSQSAESDLDRARIDVFGIGGLLCYWLLKRAPHNSKMGQYDQLIQQLHDTISTLEKSELEPEVVALTIRCLQADPIKRPKDASEVAKSFQEALFEMDYRRSQTEKKKPVKYERENAKFENKKVRQKDLMWVAIGLVLIICMALPSILIWNWNTILANQQLIKERLLRNSLERLQVRLEESMELPNTDAMILARDFAIKAHEDDKRIAETLSKSGKERKGGLNDDTQTFFELLAVDQNSASEFASQTRNARFKAAANYPNEAEKNLDLDLLDASLLRLQGRYQDSAELLDQILKNCPDWADALEASLNLFLCASGEQYSTGKLELAISIGDLFHRNALKFAELYPSLKSKMLKADVFSEWSFLLVQRGNYGDLDLAIEFAEKSLQSREEISETVDVKDIEREISISQERLAEYLMKRGAAGDSERAIRLVTASKAIREKRYQNIPNSKNRRDLWVVLNKFATAKRLRNLGNDREDALNLLVEGLALLEKNKIEMPDSPECLRDEAIANGLLGEFYLERRLGDDFELAVQHSKKQNELFSELLRRRPNSANANRDVARSWRQLGNVYFERDEDGDSAEALNAYSESLKITASLYNADPKFKVNARDHAASLEGIANFLADRNDDGDQKKALRYIKEAIEIHEELVKIDERSSESLRSLSVLLANYAWGLSLTGDVNDLQEAVSLAEQELALSRELFKRDQGSWLAAKDLAISIERLGSIAARRNTPDDLIRSRELQVEGIAFLETWRPTSDMRTVDFEDVFSINAESLAIFFARHGSPSDALKCRELWLIVLESKEWIASKIGNDGRVGNELGISYYNAGCSFALIAERQRAFGPDNASSSFDEWIKLAIEMIGKAVDSGYRDVEQVTNDSDLDILRGDPNFQAIVDRMK